MGRLHGFHVPLTRTMPVHPESVCSNARCMRVEFMVVSAGKSVVNCSASMTVVSGIMS